MSSNTQQKQAESMFEEEDSSDEEIMTVGDLDDDTTVYMTTKVKGDRILHTNEDCRYLDIAQHNIAHRKAEHYPGRRRICKACAGTITDQRGNTKAVSLRRALQYGDPEDVITEDGIQIPEEGEK